MICPSFMYKFCSDGHVVDIQRPFACNGYTYATNGHVLVRVPGIFSKHKGPDLSLIPIHKLDKLPENGGIEITQSQTWKYRQKYICKSCVGTGIKLNGDECWICEGLKYQLRKYWFLDRANLLGIVPLMMILETLGPATFFPYGLSEEPIPFRSDKAEGFVMPIKGKPDEYPENIINEQVSPCPSH